MKYQIWIEGWRANEGGECAKYLGEFEGDTFEEACAAWNRTQSSDLQQDFYPHGGRPAWWGCRLFDNEADARKFLG